MGAEEFYVESMGVVAQEAFDFAVARAEHAYGHNGYTGSIAEKDGFVMIPLPVDEVAVSYAERLVANGDGRIDDKWGPAGCIDLGPAEAPGVNNYLFFGMASA